MSELVQFTLENGEQYTTDKSVMLWSPNSKDWKIRKPKNAKVSWLLARSFQEDVPGDVVFDFDGVPDPTVFHRLYRARLPYLKQILDAFLGKHAFIEGNVLYFEGLGKEFNNFLLNLFSASGIYSHKVKDMVWVSREGLQSIQSNGLHRDRDHRIPLSTFQIRDLEYLRSRYNGPVSFLTQLIDGGGASSYELSHLRLNYPLLRSFDIRDINLIVHVIVEIKILEA